jgi:subtilisin-like proprotein convertase family protein
VLLARLSKWSLGLRTRFLLLLKDHPKTENMSHRISNALSMRKIFIHFCLSIFCSSLIIGQSAFTSIKTEQVSFADKAIYQPKKFAAFQAQGDLLANSLKKGIQNEGMLALPMPSGKLVDVKLSLYRVAEKGFYERYPQIQTFAFSSEDGKITGFGSMSDRGFHAIGRSPKGQFYIDPTATSEINAYASYYASDYPLPDGVEGYYCGNDELMDDIDAPGVSISSEKSSKRADREPLRQYKLAVATTGEYAQFHGGTKEAIAAELVNLIIRVNEIMRREFSIEYILIENTDTLFFLDPDTDGFTNGNTGELIDEVDGKISNFIPDSLYDIGHILCTITNSIGGLATTSAVCRNSRKRRGVSCSGNPIGDRFYVELVCHEMGHQMGSRHSFNHCRGNNENLPTGYEPGSGTTIMAYAGICGMNNTSTITDPYYNIGSIQSIKSYMHNGFGTNCAVETERPGQKPELNLPYDEDVPLQIPKSTPFELSAIPDENNPDLLYCWEQYDVVSFNCDTRDPSGNCPLFRSRVPTINPTRVFPRIQNIVNGTNSRWAKLPDYERSMQFMCTLRDWDPDGGALDWELVKMDVSEGAGPFEVGSISGNYDFGDQIEILWDVANTDAAPISCEKVDIYMSQDGGLTYPDLLAEGVRNSGRLVINAPEIPTANAKIKVKAHDNVFFNISGSTFSINAPTEPSFTAFYPAYFEQVCQPNEGIYTLETSPILNFEENIIISEIKGLPAGASWEANPSVAQAGEDIEISINFGGIDKQEFNLQAVLTSTTTDTVLVEMQTQVISNDFSGLSLAEPPLNQENTNTITDFGWAEVEDALRYRVELALNPSFENIESAVEVEVGEANFNQINGYQLASGETYYWRVIPINECGDGPPSEIFVLRTEAVSCKQYSAIDLPESILPTSNAEVESKINVEDDGILNSIEVQNMRGTHPFVGEIRARLESPAGTSARLFTEECFNLSDFNVSFSDLAASELQCPLSSGNTHRPQDEFGVFEGESTQGDWKLIIEDRTAGNGGSFQGWGLELCGALAASPPSFSSDTLYVSRGGEQFLKKRNLLAEKAGLSSGDITYTVVEGPKHGNMKHGESTVDAGDQFIQWAVDRWHITYTHNGSDEDLDYITFVVEDSEGGWIGLDTLPIKVDAVLQREVAIASEFEIYPNPASDQFFVFPPKGFRGGHIEIFSATGKPVLKRKINGAQRLNIRSNLFGPGLYYVQLTHNGQQLSRKLIIQ